MVSSCLSSVSPVSRFFSPVGYWSELGFIDNLWALSKYSCYFRSFQAKLRMIVLLRLQWPKNVPKVLQAHYFSAGFSLMQGKTLIQCGISFCGTGISLLVLMDTVWISQNRRWTWTCVGVISRKLSGHRECDRKNLFYWNPGSTCFYWCESD